jgi:O-succinylbenzoate synthase
MDGAFAGELSVEVGWPGNERWIILIEDSILPGSKPMQVDELEVFYAVLPLTQPWRTAYGMETEIHSVLVRMRSGDQEGWGEGTPFLAPTYSPETASSAFFLVSELFGPALVGQELGTAEDLLGCLHPFKGNPIAKAALESAWWTLQSAMTGTPLHRLLGGETHSVQAGADFGVQDSYEALLEKIQAAVERGYPRIKLKACPGWDVEMVRVVRQAFPTLRMHIDCNASYSIDQVDIFKKIDALGLEMIEQPLGDSDLHDHAELQRHLTTPLCLDESIKSVRDFELALRLGACQVLNIKYGRVGGLSVAKRLHDMAERAGVPCWVGSLLESGIGAGINIELAALGNFSYPGDLFESQRFYLQDIIEPQITMNEDCTFSPALSAGNRYPPVMDRVERVTRQRKLLR